MPGKARGRGGAGSTGLHTADDHSESEEENDLRLDDILHEIKEFHAETGKNLGVIKQEVTELRESFGHLSMDAAESRIAEGENCQNAMTKALLHSMRLEKQLEERCEQMESHSPKCNVRIHSVCEKITERGDMVKFVKEIIRDKLGMGLEKISIAAAHRIGKKTRTEDRPRSIIVRFQNENMKQRVLRAAWETKDLKIRDKRIYFEEDFTDRIYKERGQCGRKQLLEKNIKSRIVYPAKLKVFEKDGQYKLFDNPQAAAEGVQAYGVMVDIQAARPDFETTLKAAGWQTAGAGKKRTRENEDELMASVKTLLDSQNRHGKDND
ncbi:uncharacterized protein LOC117557980 [Xyrichtys novacula]|uniref:Uncharacterized protein LOC117557980 n=1 Tax=Xyrichtys novacula TaxID=13765 RepID=A0AAV1FWC4_XYRNO|nr:uncharacterized protein LOC117557980 [Xyrichtys novacula]